MAVKSIIRGIVAGPSRCLAAYRSPIRDAMPTFEHPISQLVSGEQIRHEAFERWRVRLGMRAGLNRKLWEYVYIARVLEVNLDLTSRPRVVGFGVGRERLPAALAALGCDVLATDFPACGNGKASDWTARSLDDLRTPLDGDWDNALRGIPLCHAEIFDRSVHFRGVDMTAIPPDIEGFDGLWSCGSLEHLGGLKSGIEFIMQSLRCLRPGGTAVHTTEYNLTSDRYTMDNDDICFYRKRDLVDLVGRLRTEGHQIELTLCRENTVENNDVDRTPFNYELTMNAQYGVHVITSVGLVIRKGER